MEMPVTPTIRMTLRLPEDLHRQIEELSVEESRSLNGEIVHLLRQAIQKQSSSDGPQQPQ